MAAKSRRQKSGGKKGSSAKTRRASTLSRSAARRTAAKTKSKLKSKAAGATKPKAKGAKARMIASNKNKKAAQTANNKKNTTERTSKQAAELARKPLTTAKKPAEQPRKPVEQHVKKPAEQVRKAVEARLPDPIGPKKPTHQRQGFKTHEYIVYPAHGVGQITAIEEQEVAGYRLELFVISFAKDKMTLRVPTTKVTSVGMRKLAEPGLVKRALETLKGRARVKRTMWSRRAQEYEAKINSGDINAIAEVVRDLYRSESQPEQSYSERQLYEAALDRLAREIAAVERVTETEAVKEIEGALAKGPRRGPKPTDGADEEALVEEAA